MNKCVFLDRDGVINKDFTDYAYTLDRFIILDGVREAVKMLKEAGYLMMVVTNQAGISKGIYTRFQMQDCHDYMMKELDHRIDKIYYSPWHPDQSASLSRKPDTLMFERAIARFDIDVNQSWIVGDRKTDILAGKKMGLKTIQVAQKDGAADYEDDNLLDAANRIINFQ